MEKTRFKLNICGVDVTVSGDLDRDGAEAIAERVRAIGSLIITVVEFLFGLLVNRVLHLHVWDYSALPLNIMGQICLPFSLIWFVLTIPASALCKLCCRLSAFPKETKSASVITDP